MIYIVKKAFSRHNEGEELTLNKRQAKYLLSSDLIAAKKAPVKVAITNKKKVD